MFLNSFQPEGCCCFLWVFLSISFHECEHGSAAMKDYRLHGLNVGKARVGMATGCFVSFMSINVHIHPLGNHRSFGAFQPRDHVAPV